MIQDPVIRVVIADDHAIFRRGVKAVLHTIPSQLFCIVEEAENGYEALRAVDKHRPHIVLMDVQMPKMDGIEATSNIKDRYPEVRVIALSYADDCEHVLAMTKAGADGYLLKNGSLDEMSHAIWTVHQGYTYFTPSTSSYLTAQIRNKRETEQRAKLTKREAEILGLICEGYSSKEIATNLIVSKRTVDTIRDNIIKKTGVKNSLQLLRYAIREKLVKA